MWYYLVAVMDSFPCLLCTKLYIWTASLLNVSEEFYLPSEKPT